MQKTTCLQEQLDTKPMLQHRLPIKSSSSLAADFFEAGNSKLNMYLYYLGGSLLYL